MTRLERFDNHDYDENRLIPRKRRLLSQIILILAGLSLAIIAGTGLYFFRDLIHDAAVDITATVRRGISSHCANGGDSDAIVPFLKEIFGCKNAPASSPQEKAEDGRDTPAAFLYTVELTDGGRIEGQNISTGKGTVTITDDSGVKVRIDRNRVARISRIPL